MAKSGGLAGRKISLADMAFSKVKVQTNHVVMSLLRFFHRSYSSVAKSQLAALRSKTGFPLSKCKEALSVNDGDLDVAEKWLLSRAQAEGWAKMEKLKDRSAKQGLIGLLIRENKGTMVEVNCETDFVAKNEKFQSLVSAATLSLSEYQPTPQPPSSTPSVVTAVAQDQLSQLRATQDPSSPLLGDLVASSVGLLAENIVLQQGCTLTSCEGEGLICGHVYNNVSPTPELAMGKYGILLHLAPTNNGTFTDVEAVKKLGRDIGQHIIGTNPTVIHEGDKGVSDPTQVLTMQGFVLNNEVLVGDMLAERGTQVTKFIRYALGES